MITLSEAAVRQIKVIQAEEKRPSAALRVAVVGGGCSGMSYKLDFVDGPGEQDKVFEQDGIRVIVDPKSYLYLKGLTLDYSGGLNGTGFRFSNPNATKSCGCGTSFSVG
jgi:iron-sulfur cluster assembly protein